MEARNDRQTLMSCTYWQCRHTALTPTASVLMWLWHKHNNCQLTPTAADIWKITKVKTEKYSPNDMVSLANQWAFCQWEAFAFLHRITFSTRAVLFETMREKESKRDELRIRTCGLLWYIEFYLLRTHTHVVYKRYVRLQLRNILLAPRNSVSGHDANRTKSMVGIRDAVRTRGNGTMWTDSINAFCHFKPFNCFYFVFESISN